MSYIPPSVMLTKITLHQRLHLFRNVSDTWFTCDQCNHIIKNNHHFVVNNIGTQNEFISHITCFEKRIDKLLRKYKHDFIYIRNKGKIAKLFTLWVKNNSHLVMAEEL